MRAHREVASDDALSRPLDVLDRGFDGVFPDWNLDTLTISE